jgi:hypothetical protein
MRFLLLFVFLGGCSGNDPAAPMCVFRGVPHAVGERFADDCNTCTCEPDLRVQCTLVGCLDASLPDAGPPFDAGGGFDGGTEDAGAADAEATVCAATAVSTLEGVAIAITSTDCEFTLAEAAAGIDFEYRVTIGEDAPDEVITRTPAGVTCTRPVEEIGLILFEDVSGGGQRYCECDNGFCPPVEVPSAPVVGTQTRTLRWTGRNWHGPSDTGMPLGAPFPAGEYVFAVSSEGESGGSEFEARAALPFRLVP